MDPYQMLIRALLPVVLVGCAGTQQVPGETEEGLACVETPADAECPLPEDVDPATMIEEVCGSTVLSVDGPGEVGFNPEGGTTGGTSDTAVSQYCCYPVTLSSPGNSCSYGRPYVLEGASRLAATRHGAGWVGERSPEVAGLSDDARKLLADAWISAALDEHAAVAAFARVALDLLALGAPAHLVARTTEAATEEVAHARLGFALASGYAGRAVSPGAFPLGGSVPVASDLASFAAATAREGCLGETLTTLVALECLAASTDEAVQDALRQITADELGHARLAWATVRWAIDAGGAPVRDAVAAVFARALADGIALPERLADGPHRDALVAHGVPDAAMARHALDRGLREVVLPAARALLSGGDVRPELSAHVA